MYRQQHINVNVRHGAANITYKARQRDKAGPKVNVLPLTCC